MRLAVTAGYGGSLHAVALIHELAARGHDVAVVLEVRVLNSRRLRFYLRQLGWRKLWHKARSRWRAGSHAGDLAEETAPILEHLRAQQIPSRRVSQACKATDARLVRVAGLNAARALDALRSADVDLVVYAGGGILRRSFIEIPRLGVLNGHGGPLPCFRGMNVSEWALFHGVRPLVAVHFIDPGIDTGPLLLQRPIPVQPGDSIARVRGVAVRVTVEALLEAVQLVADNAVRAVPQDLPAGRQYFTMADPLLEVVQRWLREGRTPVIDADAFAFPNVFPAPPAETA
jgi:folate-dependent phosphoribosylglycinamide formyltransferase PurN